MDTIKVDGAELSSLALGPPTAPAVALLHGLISGNMASWYSSQALPLSDNRRVVLYDQRGHGSSSLPTSGFDLDRQTADLDFVLRHHRLSAPVDLVGHSYGALIALRFALSNPGRVRRLVLVDAPMPASEYVAPSLRELASVEQINTYVETQLGDNGRAGRVRDRFYRRLQALLFDSTLIADLLSMEPETDDALAALRVPVLLIFGTQSPCIKVGHQLRQLLPQAQLILLDCGHYVLEEAPGELRSHLQEFLSPI